MRANLVLIIGIVVAAILAAWFMVPNPAEIAEMRLRDNDIEPAEQYFAERYRDGDHSPQTIGRLSEIYFLSGEPDRAVALAQTYVKAHPSDPSGLRVLANYLQAARRYREWNQVLEQMYHTAPNDDLARQLALLAMQFNDAPARIRYLEILNQHKIANSDEILELARRLAARGDKRDARVLLVDWLETRPQRVPIEARTLAAALSADTDDADALHRLTTVALVDSGVYGMVATLDTIIDRGKLRLALPIALEAANALPDNVAVITRLASIYAALGDQKRAYTLLFPLAQNHRLRPDQILTVVEVALALKQLDEAFAVAGQINLADVPPDTARELVELAIEQKRYNVLSMFDARMTKAQRDEHPLIAALLALSLGRTEEARRALESISPYSLSVLDRLSMAQAYDRLGEPATAITLLRSIADDPAVPSYALGDLGRMYLDLHRAAEGLTLFRMLRSNRPSTAVDDAWARLETTAGDPDAVMGWLQGVKDPERQSLSDIYYAALERPAPALALMAARLLDARFPGDNSQRMLARALLENGDPAQALALARPLAETDPDAEDVYLSALEKLGRGAELQSYLIARMLEPGLGDKRRTELGYVLADHAGGLAKNENGELARFLDVDAARDDLDPAARELRYNLLGLVAPERALAFAGREMLRDPARFGPLWASTLIERGRADEVYARLQQFEREHRLPDSLAPTFIGLALDRGDDQPAWTVATRIGLGNMPDDVALRVVQTAEEHGAAQALKDLDAGWPLTARAERPMLAAEIDLARGDKEGAMRWVQVLADRGVTSLAAKLDLARLYDRLGQSDQALAHLVAIADDPATPATSLADLARLFVDLKREREGLALFERLRRERNLPIVDESWARLAARAGDPAVVLAWVTAHPNLGQPLLLDLYFGAVDRGAGGLAVALGRRLLALDPGPDNRRRMARALLLDKKPLDAAQSIESLLPGTYDDTTLYVEALTLAGRKVQLRDFLLKRLALDDLDDKQRTDLAWALVGVIDGVKADAKAPLAVKLAQDLSRPLSDAEREPRIAILSRLAPGLAADILAPLARANPKKWGEDYLTLLIQTNRRDQAVDYLRGQAERGGGDEQTRRALASRLLELGGRQAAQAVFQALAEGYGPNSTEVSDLLFLWGPVPTAAQLDWLLTRARAADNADDRAAWLRLALDRGGRDKVLAYLDGLTPPGGSGPTLGIYIDVLADRKDTKRMGQAIQRAIAAGAEPASLERYAELAEGLGDRADADSAWKALLARRPDDIGALRGLAGIAMADNRRTDAMSYYDRLFAKTPGNWRDLFNYGELLLGRERPDDAKTYFERALADIDRQKDQAIDARITRAHLLHRLGRDDEALAIFAALMQERPSDKDLLADYAGVLLELGRTADAAKLIARYRR